MTIREIKEADIDKASEQLKIYNRELKNKNDIDEAGLKEILKKFVLSNEVCTYLYEEKKEINGIIIAMIVKPIFYKKAHCVEVCWAFKPQAK